MARLNSDADRSFNESGFTIVELLVVIVVIGILAAISLVSYSGISKRAIEVSLRSDLSNAATQLKMFNVENGSYPATISTDCSASPTSTTNLCLKPSAGNDYSRIPYVRPTRQSFTLTIANGDLVFSISENSSSIAVVPPVSTSFISAWGGIKADRANSIIQTGDSGYAIAGYTESYSAGANNSDAFLAKYNSTGVLVWNKTWGGTSYDAAESVIQTSDGGYVVVGSTASYAVAGTGGDTFILKYDSIGDLVWSKTWGGASSDHAYSVIQTDDDSYVVTGYADISGAGNDVFLLKYDSTGNLIWNKTWGSAGSDGAMSLMSTSDGGYMIAGSTNITDVSYGDTLLLKYDSNGSLVWNKTWGGATKSDNAKSVIQTNDGNYVVAGSTDNYSHGNSDMFLIKYDTTGAVIWSKVWGGTGYDYAYSVVQTNDGGYVVAGYGSSFGAGSYSLMVVKYNSSGDLEWNKTFSGSSWAFGASIVKTTDNGYAVAGWTNSYGAGSDDMLFVKFRANGIINNCVSPMCQTPGLVVLNSLSPAISFGTPTTAILAEPTANVGSPSARITSPTTTSTVIVAP